jgi:predicted 2-oxoglutarate/Fe(II)-dependent dioxygenase YbiX
MGGGQAAPRLVQSDVSGPPSADSVRSGLKLDSTVAAAYAAALKQHLEATAALRDSVGRSAEAAGLARAKIASTAPLEEQAALGMMLDKLVKRVRKADDDFLETAVKPLLLKPQWKSYKRWIDHERTPLTY